MQKMQQFRISQASRPRYKSPTPGPSQLCPLPPPGWHNRVARNVEGKTHEATRERNSIVEELATPYSFYKCSYIGSIKKSDSGLVELSHMRVHGCSLETSRR